MKITAALRMLSYGVPADYIEETMNVGESSAHLCLIELCRAVFECLGKKHLSPSSKTDIIRIERQFAEVGFLRCVGCMDAVDWCGEHAQNPSIGSTSGRKVFLRYARRSCVIQI